LAALVMNNANVSAVSKFQSITNQHFPVPGIIRI
jgi:hypothetical protein